MIIAIVFFKLHVSFVDHKFLMTAIIGYNLIQDPMAKMCLIYQLLDCIDFLLFYLFIFGGVGGGKDRKYYFIQLLANLY